jgi:succinate-semialdehyde dehydrogenase/glutarate-semialdehyde dehydrogenase
MVVVETDLLRRQGYLGGKWVDADSGETFPVHDPATGEVLADLPRMGAAETRRAIEAAARAYPGWRARPAKERARLLRRLADLMLERQAELARLLVAEQGKPLAEAEAEVAYAASFYEWFGEEAKRVEGDTIPSPWSDKRVVVLKEPVGVTAGITPWNFPTLIPVELIAPGIAAGNTLVVKPSEWTPVAMANFMQIMADAGLPDGVVNVVYGGGDVGERLIQDENVDCVGFVGSHTTAEKIVRAAGLKRTLIEASGNGPVIVCADADLEAAAKGAVFGGFFCAGQVCCATERVLVDKKVHDDFLAAVVNEAEGWKLGDPFDEDTLVGPMNNEPTARKMDAHLEDAVAKGAQIVVGGGRDEGRPTDLYYQPTVVDGVGLDTLINRDETFGPIVPLITVG